MLHRIFFMICVLQHHHQFFSSGLRIFHWPPCENDTDTNSILGEYHARLRLLSRSCRDIKEKFGAKRDGIYFLKTANGVVYQAFCDMTTAGGGWTLVASVHENNINGKCTAGDRWSSEQGYDPKRPDGEGTWVNTATFGTVEGAASDDYKNPGYYDITGEDVSVWHVDNNAQLENWALTGTSLRYHTETKFLKQNGGNLYHLFQKYPVSIGEGDTSGDNGPSVPVVYDFPVGDKDSTIELFRPFRGEDFDPHFITFRVFNQKKAVKAMCPWIKSSGWLRESYCIGGLGPDDQCGDFSGLWNFPGAILFRKITESAVLIFYR